MVADDMPEARLTSNHCRHPRSAGRPCARASDRPCMRAAAPLLMTCQRTCYPAVSADSPAAQAGRVPAHLTGHARGQLHRCWWHARGLAPQQSLQAAQLRRDWCWASTGACHLQWCGCPCAYASQSAATPGSELWLQRTSQVAHTMTLMACGKWQDADTCLAGGGRRAGRCAGSFREADPHLVHNAHAYLLDGPHLASWQGWLEQRCMLGLQHQPVSQQRATRSRGQSAADSLLVPGARCQ